MCALLAKYNQSNYKEWIYFALGISVFMSVVCIRTIVKGLEETYNMYILKYLGNYYITYTAATYTIYLNAYHIYVLPEALPNLNPERIRI